MGGAGAARGAGRRPDGGWARGGGRCSHFPSPTAWGAGAAGRAPPAGRALWTRPRGKSSLPGGRKRQSGGWCCAEPGAPPVPRQGRRRARSGPGPRAQRAGHGGLRPAAWQPQVRRPGSPRPLLSLSSASPPRALSPAASCRTLYPFESGCFLGVASVFFLFFSLFLVANFPPQLSHVSLPSLLRDFLQPLPDLPLSPVF